MDVFRFAESAPARIDDYIALQQPFRYDAQLREHGFVAVLRVLQHVLDCNEIIP